MQVRDLTVGDVSKKIVLHAGESRIVDYLRGIGVEADQLVTLSNEREIFFSPSVTLMLTKFDVTVGLDDEIEVVVE